MELNRKINRRLFFENCGRLGSASLLCSLSPPSIISNAFGKNPEHQHEARWYEKVPHKKVKCTLCPRECVVDDRERGYCGVRENWDGTYYTLVHSKPCTYHNDPIEKKPLFHFLPGTNAFSIATVGCNVDCQFCQNWQISQIRPEQADNLDLPPNHIADMARKARTIHLTSG